MVCSAALAALGAFTAGLSALGHVFPWLEQLSAAAPEPESLASFAESVKLFAATAVLAAYEEVLYRFYLPTRLASALKTFFSSFAQEKNITAAAEITAALLFAFAHRYLGFLPVFNALGAAIVLRLTVKKTGTVYGACAVHAIYNCGIMVLQRY